MALITAVVQVQSLAQVLPHAMDVAKKKELKGQSVDARGAREGRMELARAGEP